MDMLVRELPIFWNLEKANLYKIEHERKIVKYIFTKFKHLIILFYVWLGLYGIVNHIMLGCGWANYG